jgi:hypothetical protein
MLCIYCNESVPSNWYEHHCIPVARVDGQWVDMYNRLMEMPQPIESVAHIFFYIQDERARRTDEPSRPVPH